MHTKRWTIAGTALATLALTASSIGVVAQDAQESWRPAAYPPPRPGYAELDQALSGEPQRARRSRSRPSGSVARATTSRRPSPPSRRPRASTSWSTRSAPATRPCCKVSRRGRRSRLTSRCWPSRPPSLEYGAGGSSSTSPPSWTPRSWPPSMPPPRRCTRGDSIWAIPYKVDVKCVVWYPIKAFEDRGLRHPHDLGRADRAGRPDRGRRQGQPVLRRHRTPARRRAGRPPTSSRTPCSAPPGLEAYDKWISHELPFNSPEVKAALDLVAGRSTSPRTTSWVATRPSLATSPRPTPMDPMFERRHGQPRAAGCTSSRSGTAPTSSRMQRTERRAQSKYVIGEDIGIFPLPPVDPLPCNPALGAGDGADGLRRSARGPRRRPVPLHARRHRGLGEGAAAPSPPTQTVPAEWYAGNYKSEVAAGSWPTPRPSGFDASDLMPAAVGAGSFWTGMVDWIAANGENTEAVLQAIDASWPTVAGS